MSVGFTAAKVAEQAGRTEAEVIKACETGEIQGHRHGEGIWSILPLEAARWLHALDLAYQAKHGDKIQRARQEAREKDGQYMGRVMDSARILGLERELVDTKARTKAIEEELKILRKRAKK